MNMPRFHLPRKLRHQVYSIRTSIMLYFVLLISVLILMVSTLSYVYSTQDAENLSINYTESLIAEINMGVDSYIANIKSMSAVICANREVQDLLAYYNSLRGGDVPAEDTNMLARMRYSAAEHLSTVAGTRAEITNVAVISKYHDVLLNDLSKQINTNSEYNITDWFLKPLSIKEDIIVSPSHVQNLVRDEYMWVISISRAVIDRTTGEVTGVMVIDLNFQAIEAICETVQLGKNGYTYLIDSDKNIIYHPQQQLLYAGIKSEPFEEILKLDASFLRADENKIYTKNTSSLTGWTAVGVINADELIRNRTSIVNFYFTLSAISLVLATVAALIISSSVTKPLKQLESAMHLVEQGDLTIRARTDVNNEIGQLGKTFNTMVGEIKTLMESTVANEEAKRKSEINALQAQINPHFLYNTLDTIIWMSASGKTDEVTEVTAALAKLFRTSISKGENYVTVRNELENIDSYLTIQKMRYGEKLAFSVDVPNCYLEYTVPKLILQPLVENALYHGIKISPDAGVIHIGAHQTENFFVLSVSDNGVGMNSTQLEHLFLPKPESDHGIGVRNVHHRIQLCYGSAYGLHYASAPGEGTYVEIWLPIPGRAAGLPHAPQEVPRE